MDVARALQIKCDVVRCARVNRAPLNLSCLVLEVGVPVGFDPHRVNVADAGKTYVVTVVQNHGDGPADDECHGGYDDNKQDCLLLAAQKI